ncbi:hypothetical protein ASE23_24130 [Rhizobium sp. Root73]|uniref:hypothetical protein n=1 Tax=unclassified Rhizobium TaxID=2613769 RepID=UPI00072A0422|nr:MULTISPECIES: hypothetical protein [unclassified Rhizobium]KQX98734.1 hypothetical protein ASD36_21750 [Rhizobium sp. Root1334]KRC10642.1 hypothetical protein ASE23_24130 [Rhizobium sp. Root73]
MAPNKASAYDLMKATLLDMHRLVSVDYPVGDIFRSLRDLATFAGDTLALLDSFEADESELAKAIVPFEAFPHVIRIRVDFFGKAMREKTLTPAERTEMSALHAHLVTYTDIIQAAMEEVTQESRRNRYAEAGYVETAIHTDLKYDSYLAPFVADALRLEITEKTPSQDIAPFQYEMTETGLFVLPLHSVTDGERERFVEAQRAHLMEVAAEITMSLASSNCSAQLKWVFALVGNKLKDEGVILLLGQAVATAQEVFLAEENSLMDHLAALLRNQLSGLDRYLSNFEDWRSFVSSSTDVAVSNDDEIAMSDSLIVLSGALAAIPTVDSEVVSSLNEAAQWRASGKRSRGGRILAMARTLGNLASAVFKSLGKAVVDTGRKNIASIILAGIVSVLGAMQNIPGLQWLPAVIEAAKALLRLP